jgi:hypothetical protein
MWGELYEVSFVNFLLFDSKLMDIQDGCSQETSKQTTSRLSVLVLLVKRVWGYYEVMRECQQK